MKFIVVAALAIYAVLTVSVALPTAEELREEGLLVVKQIKPRIARSATGISCPAADSLNSVYFADPTDCNSFFQCSNGEPYHFTCPADLVFNPNLNVCDYPANYECGVEGSGK